MIRILCVDDDPLVREYLVARLSVEPDVVVVGQAESAAAACGVLRETEVDLVLLDYYMEGTDGLRLLQSIALWYEALPEGRSAPAVLFCTGCADPDFEPKARAAGARGVVVKDQVAAALIPAVRAVAGGS